MRRDEDLVNDPSDIREEKEAELVQVRSDIDRACRVAQVEIAYLALSSDVRGSLGELVYELQSEMIGLAKMREREKELLLFLEKN